MSNKPLISIVIPSYNHGHLIARAIKSVLAQTYSNWEAIIIDNHSTDQTQEVISRFKDNRIKFIEINNDGIIALSRNKGIKIAEGQWIAFLDSDDWWSPSKLQATIDHALQENADLVYHNLKIARKHKQKLFPQTIHSNYLQAPVYESLVKSGNIIPNSSVLIRKSILDKVDGISEDKLKVTWEDYDCWLRVAKISNSFSYLNSNLGFYWLGGDNTSNPNRTLKNLSSIYQLYLLDSKISLPFWFTYSLGTALMQCGHYRDGINVFSKTIIKNESWRNRLKYLIRYIQSCMGVFFSDQPYSDINKFNFMKDDLIDQNDQR